MNKKPIISCRDLSVHFPIGGGLFEQKQFVRAVNNVNLSIPQGSFFGLVGESGSGKTTLIKTILIKIMMMIKIWKKRAKILLLLELHRIFAPC